MSTVQQNIVLTLEKSESPVKNELEILPQDCFLVFAGSFSDGAEGETGNSSFLHLKRSGWVLLQRCSHLFSILFDKELLLCKEIRAKMSALDVLRQIKQSRRAQLSKVKIVEWGNAEYINSIGIDNLTRKELRNHLEARDLDTTGTRLELLERLRGSLVDEQLHKFAYVETLDTEQAIETDLEERGSVYVSGSNQRGQLGVGDKEPRRYFTVVPALRGVGVVFVTSSAEMCYAVTEEHDVYVWGGGGVGRTGLNLALMKKSVTDASTLNNWMEPQIVADLAGEEVSRKLDAINCATTHVICVT
jgi:hypothetical protein